MSRETIRMECKNCGRKFTVPRDEAFGCRCPKCNSGRLVRIA